MSKRIISGAGLFEQEIDFFQIDTFFIGIISMPKCVESKINLMSSI